jgi:hypothetical protein
MSTRRSLVVLLMIMASVPFSATAGEPQPLMVRAIDETIATTRTFFIGAAVSNEDAIEFRLRLIDAGAYRVNLFLPDRVIVCDLPDHLAASIDVPAGFSRATAREIDSQPSYTYSSWSWIADAYRTLDNPPPPAAGALADFKDVVLTVPADQVAAAQRDAMKSPMLRAVAPDTRMLPDIAHGSSFLGGSITANFIFAESNGAIETDLEDWSDPDLVAARQGAAEAMLTWTLFPKMDISFVIYTEDRVATGYEPITHSMRNDGVWMLDCLRTLGFGSSGDVISSVHEFNQTRRVQAGTQWVFSAFIACSRNTPGHRFASGTADYTAYAFLGGPCLVQPFPSSEDPNGVGERLVYSQIVNHEAGHCFWTLDEYPGAPGSCSSASGYLNHGNGNLSSISPGGVEMRCNPLQECIMHQAARKSIIPRPWCQWSRGHLGVVDANSNGMPDIFEAAPGIEFLTAGPDTVHTNQYTMRFRAVARAVPNRNPNIAPEKRVDYAVPPRKVWLGNAQSAHINLVPIDGQWGELVEEFEFHVELGNAGPTSFTINVENAAGYGGTSARTVYFVGVNYTRTGVAPKANRNSVTWEVAGNPFGAKFDVYRLEAGESMPGDLIKQNVSPGTPRAGFIPYLFDDFAVVPGRDYRYYVEGYFSLAYQDTIRSYSTRSKVIGQTAMIPVAEGVISNIAPNPTRGSVTFSVAVPRVYGGSPSSPTRLAAPVNVSIYSVNGQRVRTLSSKDVLDDVLTLRWDGTDEKNRPVPSGIYFVRATAGSTKGFQKIVLIR